MELNRHFYEHLENLRKSAPWQLHARSTSYERELVPFLDGNFFLQDGSDAFVTVIEIGWRGRAHGEALVSVLAILAYRAQEGRLPDSLGDLVTSGYLNSIPIDPYNGAGLIYKATGDDFTLYSLDADFADDGGAASQWRENEGDLVFWPVQDAAQDL